MDEAWKPTPGFGCNAFTIKLTSGAYFDYENPQKIALVDIAWPLARICRFGGQLPMGCPVYSVAEHSINCYLKAEEEGHEPDVLLATLMHDAAEAVCCDVMKPLKCLIEPLYGPIEERCESAVARSFGIDFAGTKPIWKRIDMQMLIAERDAIFGADGVVWTGEGRFPKHVIVPRYLSVSDAAKGFISCFEEIMERI